MPPLALELQTTRWFNTDKPLTLQALRGKVVVLHAFQMLCPGCVSHALPQMVRLFRQVDPAQVAVIGLHSVFEHHDVMTPQALAVFIHEYRLGFPIAVDQPSPSGGLPATMRAYGFQGTPSLVLIDRQGCVQVHEFGQVDDLALGMAIGRLAAQPPVDAAARATGEGAATPGAAGCADGACELPPRRA